MQLFVYEYTSSIGAAGLPETDTLRLEGRAMLAALLEDFARIPGVEVHTLLDGSWAPATPVRVTANSQPEKEAALFSALARAADRTLVIAPELEDLLYTRCRWVEEAGGHLLGASPAAVRLTADKLALGQHLQAHGVPTPACRPFAAADVPYPAVWKPRHGAGSVATFLVHDRASLAAALGQARAEGWRGESLVQPYLPGQPASVGFLTGPRGAVPLRPATQWLSGDGRFHYLGGELPLPEALAARAVALAARAIEAVPGLKGYVGVDLILGDAADGSRDGVIEINPRLTTSYVGLRALARENLADALLRVAIGEVVPLLTWKPGKVRFRSDGGITMKLSPTR